MDSIITYLLTYNQYLLKIISQLLWFIAKNIPLGQFKFDDSTSPEYQKFKVDKLPTIIKFEKVDYRLLLGYYKHKYNKTLVPINRRNGVTILASIICPKCSATHDYLYDNNVNKRRINVRFVHLLLSLNIILLLLSHLNFLTVVVL